MTKRLLIAVAFVLAFLGGAVAQESVSLTTPVALTQSAQHVSYLGLDVDNNRIVATIVSNAGASIPPTVAVYDANGLTVNGVFKAATPTGATLLHTLNTANFSVNSMVKQTYTRLQTDGVIAAGSIAGSPQ